MNAPAAVPPPAEPLRRARDLGVFEPLRERAFRTIWASSLLGNFGQLILGVGAAWEMTRLDPRPSMVALVQTALMLPNMLVSVPAGAAADMFDRRKVALAGLSFATLCAGLLTALSLAGLTTPWLLLGFCSVIGVGVSLYSPAWQASVREQVPPEQLPAAVALASISYNVARSFGPAVGGLVVLLFGARAAFATNAVCYLPLVLAFFLWRRRPEPSRLPPERMDRAIVSGARYAIHSAPVRRVLIRALATGIAGASISALTPVVARVLLGGSAGTYGLLLGFYGAGAVAGATLIGRLRARLKAEVGVGLCAGATGAMMVAMGLSRSVPLTAAAMFVAGGAFMLNGALLNLGVQLSAPRWVTARALSWYMSMLTGGIAVGSVLWGHVAGDYGVGAAMVASGAALAATPLLGLALPMPRVSHSETEMVEITAEPEVALALTGRSGPVVIEIDYQVDPAQARQFYATMLELQRARLRNGGFDWSLSRDIADPALWTERYQTPTWGDYLRQRSRFTHLDAELQAAANDFRMPGTETHVRRRLERPFGSVRWRADTPDTAGETLPIYTP